MEPCFSEMTAVAATFSQPILSHSGLSLGADIWLTQHHNAHELLFVVPLSIHPSDWCSIIETLETRARFSGLWGWGRGTDAAFHCELWKLLGRAAGFHLNAFYLRYFCQCWGLMVISDFRKSVEPWLPYPSIKWMPWSHQWVSHATHMPLFSGLPSWPTIKHLRASD